MSEITLNDESIDGSEKCESESDSYVLSSKETSNFIDIQSQYNYTDHYKIDDESNPKLVDLNKSNNLENEAVTNSDNFNNLEYNSCINDLNKIPNGQTVNIDLSIDKCDTDIKDNICNSSTCDKYDISNTIENSNSDQGDLNFNEGECK